MLKKLALLLLISLFGFLTAYTQVKIEKSELTKFIDGKKYYIHYVEQGHTLYSIARVYNVSVDELIFENPSSKHQLYIGQELKIPFKSRDKEVEESLDYNEYFYHIVKEGETLRNIAKTFYVSYNAVRRSNPNKSDPLKAGDYIKIPVKSTKFPEKEEENFTEGIIPEKTKPKLTKVQKPKYIDHIVERGETLYRIAKNFKVSVEDIKKANPYISERNLSVGQYIKIPTEKVQKEYISHTVKRKERLDKLAKNYDIDITELKKANPRLRDRIRVGQTVKIPVSEAKDLVIKDLLPQEEITLESDPITWEPINQDSLDCYNPENALRTYKVALLIPLYLDEVDSLKFDSLTVLDEYENIAKGKHHPFRFIHYYYGAKMAVDSLRNQGLNVELHVFNVDNKTGNLVKTFAKPILKEMDLIVGPFYNKHFKYGTIFSNMTKIPIVNPLSSRSEIIRDNPYVFKVTPTDDYTLDMVKQLIAAQFTDAKIFMIKQLHNKYSGERDFPNYIETIDPLLDSGYSVSNEELLDLVIEKSLIDTSLVMEQTIGDTSIWVDELLPYINIEGQRIYTDSLQFNMFDSTFIQNRIIPYYYNQDSAYKFEENASIYRDNVVIVFSEKNEKVFALDLMTKLNVVKDTFAVQLVGIPNWQEYSGMDYELLNNLNAHVLSAGHVNYKNYNVNQFVRDYRKKFITDPGDYAFKSFDVFWYFLNAMKNFGKDFYDCLPYFKPANIQTDFDFIKRNQNDGFENKAWKFLKYNRYRLEEVHLEVWKPIIDSTYNKSVIQFE